MAPIPIVTLPVRSRDSLDCIICATAAVLNLDYHEVNKWFPNRRDRINSPEIISEKGISDGELSLALLHHGYASTWLPAKTRDDRGVTVCIDILSEIKNKLAICIVRNPLRHAVAWINDKMYDSSSRPKSSLEDFLFLEGVFIITRIECPK